MKIYELTQIGSHHTNHCEDTLFTRELENDKILLAVMDGCTMGIESHFASCLFKKILHKISKAHYYKSFITKEKVTLQDLLKSIYRDLFNNIIYLKNELGLDKYELLSTIVLGIVNLKSKEAKFLTIGDGIIYHDGNLIEYEQNNQPDYLAYHLEKDFEEWYASQNQFCTINNFNNLSISTDGIFTFGKFNNQSNEPFSVSEVIQLLLEDTSFMGNGNMLRKKVDIIKNEYGLIPTDDLGIIRIILS